MKIYYKLILCCTIFSCTTAIAQRIESVSSTDSIRVDVIKYLISNEQLDSIEDYSRYNQRISVTELLTNTVLGYQKSGIYGFGAHQSNGVRFLLLKDGNRHKFLSTNNLKECLSEVLAQLSNIDSANDDVYLYISKILRIYEMNKKMSIEQ